MLRLKPDDTALLGSIAALREYLGKKEDALNAYRELIRRGDNTKDTHVKAATLASSLEEWDTADSLITTALADKTPDVDILRLASSISLGKNDGAAALARLKKLTEIAPSDETAIAALEKTARAERDTDGLIWALELRIGLAPDDADTVGELSELLLHEGNREKARDCLKNGIAHAPDSGRLHVLMGNFYREQGDTNSAIAEYEKALSDNAWKSGAQQFIWQIRPPKTEEEKAEQEFFNRAKKDSSSR